jgi:hypothetical protein
MLSEIVLVELHVSRWRAKTALKLSDLGITDGKEQEREWESLLQLGNKILLPIIPPGAKSWNANEPRRTYAQVLTSIEQSARQYVGNQTIEINWGKALKLARYKEFKKGLEKYETRYFAVRDEIIADWDANLTRLQEDYAAFAADSAERLFPDSPGGRDGFVAAFVKQVMNLVPSRETFSNSFAFWTEFRFVDVSAWIGQSSLDAALKKLLKDPGHEAEAKAYQEALNAKRMILEEQKDAEEKVRNEFLASVMGASRVLFYDAACDILEGMKKNDGDLSGRAVTRLESMVTLFDRAFAADRDAAGMKKAVKDLLEMGEGRAAGDVQVVLEAIGTITRSTLMGLETAPRSARTLGIPDAPSVEQVRFARQVIKLDVPTLKEVKRRG